MSRDLPPIDPYNRPAATNTANQLQFILTAVTRHWFLVLVFGFAGMAVWGVWGLLSFHETPMYRATTLLGIKPTEWDAPDLQHVLTARITKLTPAMLERRLRDDTSWAEDVARALVQRDLESGGELGWVSGPREIQEKAGEIVGAVQFVPSPEQDGDTLTIQADFPTASEARRVVEATARVVIERNREYVIESEQKTYLFLQQQVESLREQLDEAESVEWEFRKEMGFRTHEEVLADMERINGQLDQAEASKREIWAKMEEIEAELSTSNSQLPISLGRLNDSVVTNLKSEYDALLQQQLEMSIIYQPEYPGLKAIQQDIDDKYQAILTAVERLDASASAGTNAWQDHIELRSEYRRLQLEASGLDIRTKTWKRMLNEHVEGLPELADKSFDQQRLEREKEMLAGQFDRLFDKLLETQTAVQRGQNQIEWRTDVNSAPLPGQGAHVRRWMNFLIGGLVGLVVGTVIAFVIEVSDTSIRRPEDITDYLGMDLIGTIPKMQFGRAARPRKGRYVVRVDADQVDASIVTRHDPKSPISESYRSLRTKFQFATLGKKPRTVMITSSVPAEGKTTTAVNMAVTFADSGLRVLIMDTDLRRPNVHRVLKMNRGNGLADVLREGSDIRTVVRPTRIENLWMISSGHVPPNPSELIGSERMQKVMAILGKSFDLVVCDAPSILIVTDPLLLARQVDTTVMVVAAEEARRETVKRALEILQAAGTPVAGTVLNGLRATRRNYYYYYYYYDERAVHKRRAWWTSA